MLYHTLLLFYLDSLSFTSAPYLLILHVYHLNIDTYLFATTHIVYIDMLSMYFNFAVVEHLSQLLCRTSCHDPLVSYVIIPSVSTSAWSVPCLWTHQRRGAVEDEGGEGVEVGKLPHDLKLLAPDALHLGLEGRLPGKQLQDLWRKQTYGSWALPFF